jgi:hypothetical protein
MNKKRKKVSPLFKEPAEGGDVQPDHGGLPLRARPLPPLQVAGHPGHQVLFFFLLLTRHILNPDP